jgi:hypothetical protein
MEGRRISSPPHRDTLPQVEKPSILQRMLAETARRPALRNTINSPDPLLTAVRTAYPTPPFLPFFHPPIELPSVRPRGGPMERRIKPGIPALFSLALVNGLSRTVPVRLPLQ